MSKHDVLPSHTSYKPVKWRPILDTSFLVVLLPLWAQAATTDDSSVVQQTQDDDDDCKAEKAGRYSQTWKRGKQYNKT